MDGMVGMGDVVRASTQEDAGGGHKQDGLTLTVDSDGDSKRYVLLRQKPK